MTCAALAQAAQSNSPAVSSRAAQELVAAQKQIADLTANFSLTVPGAGKDGGDLQARGEIWLASGRRYRVEYSQPEAQILVSDGKQRWLYLKKINQVQVQRLPPAGNPGELFLELGGGLPSLIARCQVQRLDDEDGLRVYELVQRPGEPFQFRRARLWLTGDLLLPKRVEVEAARRMRVEFSQVSVHTQEALKQDPKVGVSPKQFTFTCPEGAEVIEPLWPE